jgi:hypothetical protein
MNLSGLNAVDPKELLEFLDMASDEEFQELIDTRRKGVQIAAEISNGTFLVPGQKIVVMGKSLVISHQIETTPGHYLAFLDCTGMDETIAFQAQIVYHPPTYEWYQRIMANPREELRKLYQSLLDRMQG